MTDQAKIAALDDEDQSCYRFGRTMFDLIWLEGELQWYVASIVTRLQGGRAHRTDSLSEEMLRNLARARDLSLGQAWTVLRRLIRAKKASGNLYLAAPVSKHVPWASVEGIMKRLIEIRNDAAHRRMHRIRLRKAMHGEAAEFKDVCREVTALISGGEFDEVRSTFLERVADTGTLRKEWIDEYGAEAMKYLEEKFPAILGEE